MSPKRRVSFFLDEELGEGLKALKERHGTPEAESIRRAIAEYLDRHGVSSKPASRRAPARRKA